MTTAYNTGYNSPTVSVFEMPLVILVPGRCQLPGTDAVIIRLVRPPVNRQAGLFFYPKKAQNLKKCTPFLHFFFSSHPKIFS